jgi:hypothetical protein
MCKLQQSSWLAINPPSPSLLRHMHTHEHMQVYTNRSNSRWVEAEDWSAPAVVDATTSTASSKPLGAAMKSANHRMYATHRSGLHMSRSLHIL